MGMFPRAREKSHATTSEASPQTDETCHDTQVEAGRCSTVTLPFQGRVVARGTSSNKM
jgi:hypothetical protein